MTERGPGARKRILCVQRRAPHGSIYALEGLEVILMAAAFDQAVTVLFLDDGVYQIARGQNTTALGVKNFSPAFRALEHYEVERVIVERESLARRGLSPGDLLRAVEVLGREEVARLMEASEAVLSF